MGKPTVLFISQMGEPGSFDPAIFCRAPGGANEAHWIWLALVSAGLVDAIEYRSVNVCVGEALPAPETVDAVIIGGSIANVRDGHEWQGRIVDFARAYRATGRPLFGICGGHQIASFAEGGTVDYVPEGKVTGSYPVERTAAGAGHFLFDGFADDQLFHFSHGDRVETPPPGSVVLARSAEAPHAVLDHGGRWLSVQFHPEATADLFGAVYAKRPEILARFRVLPGTERMLRNFLVGTGVMAT